MLIDLKTIDRTPRHYDLVFAKEWWPLDDENYQVRGLNGQLNCSMEIYRAGVRFVLKGRLSGEMSVYCDRCLEPFSYPLDYPFRLFLASAGSDSGESEVALSEEDLYTSFFNGNEVDLDDIVREQIYLSLPMKTLCSEDCPGLCPKCGANLKEASCECDKSKGHPGFAKLKTLKINQE